MTKSGYQKLRKLNHTLDVLYFDVQEAIEEGEDNWYLVERLMESLSDSISVIEAVLEREQYGQTNSEN